MKATLLLFDGFAALDVIGGYEVLANVPNLDIEFVAAGPRPRWSGRLRTLL